MKPLSQETEITRLYLLGDLDPEAQQSFEERLLSVPELYDELLIAEDELIDDYIEDLLTEPKRQQFEKHFVASAEHRQKLSFARSLRRYVAAYPLPPPKPLIDPPGVFSWKRLVSDFLRGRSSLPLYATAVALVFFGISFWLWQTWRPENQQRELEQEVAELNRTPEMPSTALRVPLAPGLTRDSGGDRKRMEIPANATVVQLQLEVAADQYQRYRVLLQPAEGALKQLAINDLKATTLDGRRIVPLKLPARLLTRGDYDLELSGVSSGGEVEDLGRYSFRVVAR